MRSLADYSAKNLHRELSSSKYDQDLSLSAHRVLGYFSNATVANYPPVGSPHSFRSALGPSPIPEVSTDEVICPIKPSLSPQSYCLPISASGHPHFLPPPRSVKSQFAIQSVFRNVPGWPRRSRFLFFQAYLIRSQVSSLSFFRIRNICLPVCP